MKKKTVHSQIRSMTLRKITYPLLTLVVAVFVFFKVPFYSVWNPMKIGDAKQITKLYDEESYYVEINWDKLYYSGYDYLENGKWTGSYYYTLEDKICYFVLLSSELTQNRAELLNNVQLKARLISGGKVLTEVIKSMSEDLGWTVQGMAAVTCRIVVSEVDYVLARSNVLFGIDVVIAWISLVIVGRLLCFIIEPALYPTCRSIRKYGSVKAHLRQFDKEYAQENFVYGDIVLTKHYLASFADNTFQIIPLNDIVWAYKHSMFHRYRKQKITYTLRVVGKRCGQVVVHGQKKAQMDYLLAFLETHIDGIKIGYSKEIEKEVRKRR